jgi:hypothetical protein
MNKQVIHRADPALKQPQFLLDTPLKSAEIAH